MKAKHSTRELNLIQKLVTSLRELYANFYSSRGYIQRGYFWRQDTSSPRKKWRSLSFPHLCSPEASIDFLARNLKLLSFVYYLKWKRSGAKNNVSKPYAMPGMSVNICSHFWLMSVLLHVMIALMKEAMCFKYMLYIRS